MGLGNTPTGMNNLIHNVIMHPGSNPLDLKDFNTVTTTWRFKQEHFPKPGTALKAVNGWKEGSVSIRLLCTKVKQKEGKAPEFIVSGILYWDVVEVVMAKLENPDSFNNIHTTPYKEWWEGSHLGVL